MRVGVAGARGFIGARLCAALAEAGHPVVGFGREGAGEAFDALVWAGGRRSSDAAEMDAAHVAAPLAALARLAPGGRVVYLSSGEVYGPQLVPFREDVAPDPRSAYAQAKLRGERALAAAGVRLTVLRPALVYGPGQGGAMFLPQLVSTLRAGDRFPMTRGEQTRDFLHVDDLAWLVLAALAEGAPAGLYNAGSGSETRLVDVALALARLLGGEALVGVGDLPYREGEQMRYVLDGARARAAFGFRPRVGLTEGLRQLAASAAA